jgi:MFS family permease
MQMCISYLISPIVGPIYDAGHCRILLVVGTFLSALGLFMTSICEAYWQLVVAQGLVTGLGFGCLYLPGVAVVCQYFTTKKAIASGIASLGSSIG